MLNRPPILLDILHICEFIAILSGISKFKSLKNSYWVYFVFYLIYITLYEIISAFLIEYHSINIGKYLSFIQIPIEIIFFYWLYLCKSLNLKKTFWIFTVLYLFSLYLEYTLTSLNNFTFYSLSMSFGTMLLLILVFLEFIKQIKSESILNFRENKMFYINIGVILMYIGNIPFFGLYYSILKMPEIYNSYYIYFMVSNSLMYLLFAASFIWGKVK